MHQRQQVVRHLAGHVAQESTCAFAHVQDIGLHIHDDAGRRGFFQGAQVDVRERDLAGRLGFNRQRRGARAQVAASRHGRGATHGGRAGTHPENAVALVHRYKQVQAAVGRLRGAEKQVTSGAQREVEHLQDVALHFAVQVDQQVAAHDQVDLRERWVGQQAVFGEQYLFANFLAHPVVLVLLLGKVLAQPLRRYVGDDRFGVHAVAAMGNGPLINISGKHLHLCTAGVQRQLLGHQHRQAVGLFAGGASCRPDTHFLTVRHAVFQ